MNRPERTEDNVRNIIKCPLCASNIKKICHEEKSLHLDCSQKELSFRNKQYYVCESCGLIYLYPRPDINCLGNYYSNIKY